MSDGALFALADFEETREAGVVPCCDVCGKCGEAIYPDGLAVPDFYAATQWALIAINAHKSQEHPEAVS